MTSSKWSLSAAVVVVVVVTAVAVQASSTPCKDKHDGPFPHASKCSLFYNCSIGRLDECIHPQLFNPDTRKCEHYTMVQCGTRYEPKNFCDYSRTFCSNEHPSCKGLADGLHYWPERKGSPYYIVCDKERNVFQGMCSGVRLFDKEKGCYKPWCMLY